MTKGEEGQPGRASLFRASRFVFTQYYIPFDSMALNPDNVTVKLFCNNLL